LVSALPHNLTGPTTLEEYSTSIDPSAATVAVRAGADGGLIVNRLPFRENSKTADVFGHVAGDVDTREDGDIQLSAKPVVDDAQ
jgi:hypothetical protein